MKISEKDFQKQVIQLAQMFGWKVAHFRPAMNRRGRWQTAVAADGAGFPDLVLVGRSGVLWFELKVPPNKPSPEQLDWIAALDKAGHTARVLYPSDWDFIPTTLEGNRK